MLLCDKYIPYEEFEFFSKCTTLLLLLLLLLLTLFLLNAADVVAVTEDAIEAVALLESIGFDKVLTSLFIKRCINSLVRVSR